MKHSFFAVHPGVARWYKLYGSLKTMHRRMLESVGEEQFHASVTRQYPLVLDDESVIALASNLGWQSTWLSRPKAKAGPPPANRDLSEMLSATTAAGPPPGSLPGLNGYASAPMPAALPAVRRPASPATCLNLFIHSIRFSFYYYSEEEQLTLGSSFGLRTADYPKFTDAVCHCVMLTAYDAVRL